MTSPFETPVLFLIFNRPDLTEQVFQRIREQRPSRLYIAADGPRIDRGAEQAMCAKARATTESIDWPCKVERLYRPSNLGCKIAVSSAISWFFEQEEAGIILEDDCLPHQTFFRFAAEMLERYADDTRVFSISANNFQKPGIPRESSYYFSQFPHIWGWATWRRSWAKYDVNLTHWPSTKADIRATLRDRIAFRYFSSIFDNVKRGLIDTWDYQFFHSCLANNGLTIIPSTNLVTNIGFDGRATHTTLIDDPAANLPITAMEFPIVCPSVAINVDRDADSYTKSFVFRINSTFRMRMISRIRNLSKKLLRTPRDR